MALTLILENNSNHIYFYWFIQMLFWKPFKVSFQFYVYLHICVFICKCRIAANAATCSSSGAAWSTSCRNMFLSNTVWYEKDSGVMCKICICMNHHSFFETLLVKPIKFQTCFFKILSITIKTVYLFTEKRAFLFFQTSIWWKTQCCWHINVFNCFLLLKQTLPYFVLGACPAISSN